jgi:hypothetical protein
LEQFVRNFHTSLKHEIEKLIKAERQKLESEDRERKREAGRRHVRFEPLRALLEELVAAIDPAHIRATFVASVGDHAQILALGECR